MLEIGIGETMEANGLLTNCNTTSKILSLAMIYFKLIEQIIGIQSYFNTVEQSEKNLSHT